MDVLRNLVDVAAILAVIWAQWRVGSFILSRSASQPVWARKLIVALIGCATLWLAAGFALSFHLVNQFLHVPRALRGLLTGVTFLWGFSSTGAALAACFWRWLFTVGEEFNPGRRKLMNAAGNTLAAAPFAVAGFGLLVQRTDFQTREVEIPITNLPPDLRGLRILQLTDIHLGPYLDERDLERVIDESRNLRPHLAVVTGDLITMADDPLDACQIGRAHV